MNKILPKVPNIGDIVTISHRGFTKTGKVLQVGLFGIRGNNAFAFDDSVLSDKGIANEVWTYDTII